jgi:hypothetical protein
MELKYVERALCLSAKESLGIPKSSFAHQVLYLDKASAETAKRAATRVVIAATFILLFFCN